MRFLFRLKTMNANRQKLKKVRRHNELNAKRPAPA